MTPKTIIHISHLHVDLHQDGGGGISNVVKALALHGKGRDGWRVKVLCGNYDLGGDRKSEPGRQEFDPWLDQEVFEQHPHAFLGPAGGLIGKLEKEPKPFIVHVHSCFSLFTDAAMAFLGRHKIPFVFTPHGKFSPRLLGQKSVLKKLWFDYFFRNPLQRFGKVVLVGAGEVRGFQNWELPGNFEVIPNGWTPPARPPLPRANNTILFLSYLNPLKQPELLVKAFALSRAKERFTLTIAGPDSFGHRARVEAAIEKSGCAERIHLTGPAWGDEKIRLLSQAVCFCLPSKSEGFPLSLPEALGMGLPLLISRECNFPEAARRGAALELDSFAPPDQWAHAMDSLLLNPERLSQMSQKALGLGQEMAWPRLVEKWLSVYEDRWKTLLVNERNAS